MNHYLQIIFLFIAGLLSVASLHGQSDADSAYLHTNLPVKTFDAQHWKESTSGIDYSKGFEENEVDEDDDGEGIGVPYDNSTRPKRGNGLFNGGFWAGFFKILFIFLAIGVLAVLAYHILGSSLRRPGNPKIKAVHSKISIEKIEDHIHESDLDHFLKEAIAAKDYRLAIRLYYLAAIKELSLQKVIKWKREKTNRHYLGELKNFPIFDAFREATQVFERSWYGNVLLGEQDFLAVQPGLQQLVLAAKQTSPISLKVADGK